MKLWVVYIGENYGSYDENQFSIHPNLDEAIEHLIEIADYAGDHDADFDKAIMEYGSCTGDSGLWYSMYESGTTALDDVSWSIFCMHWIVLFSCALYGRE